MSRVGIAIVCALCALVAAPSAQAATASRAEYSAQVNPICAASNAEQERLIGIRIAQIEKLEDGNDKQEAKADRLFDRVNGELLQIAYAAQVRIDAIPAAPGDEALVAQWTEARRQELALSARINRLGKRVDRLFNQTRRFRNPGKLFQKAEKIERQIETVYLQLEGFYEIDVELATVLNVAYCVTGATGSPAVAGGV